MSASKKINVGFDISQTGPNKAGCGYYAHAMIQNLLALAKDIEFTLYPSFGDFYFNSFMPIRNQYRKGNYGPRHLTREFASNFWNNNNLEIKLNKPDIIHANNFWCPTQLKVSKLIYTFYDMGFLYNPDWTTEANRFGCYSGVYRASIFADWIVAISEASKQHYLEIFPFFPEDRIQVIYPCSRFNNLHIETKKPKALAKIVPGKFWLVVGTIEPRKNQLMLSKAYARYLALGGEPMPLVFAGGKGWLMENFNQDLQTLGITDKVIFTGYVSDAELVWLYKSCFANLYPSLFEGFGLPVLEGMQFGAATITTDTTSIPEVSGQAATLLPPDDVESWAQNMLNLVNFPEKRAKLQDLALQQAKKFSWQESAKQLSELYEKVATYPKARGY